MFEDLLKGITREAPRPLAQLPGLRYSTAVPRQIMWFVLIFGVFFLLMPLSILRTDPNMRLASGQNATAQGQVIAVGEPDESQGRGRRLIYEFTPPQGVPHRGSAMVRSNSPYYSIKAGETLPVRYLAGDPGVNAIANGRADQPPLFVICMFPLLFVLLFGMVLVAPLRQVLRARQAFKKGRLAQGVVVYVRRRQNTGWGNQLSLPSYDIFIAYQTPQGTHEAQAWCNNDWLLKHLAPGGTVNIAYLPDKPDRIVLLEAFLR